MIDKIKSGYDLTTWNLIDLAVIEVKCRYCSEATVVKNGLSPNGTQRYRCRSCGRCFQLNYRYHAHQPGMAERIVDMAFNGSGVRDTSRVLKISQNTVIRRLKKLNPAQVSRQQSVIDEVTLICEMDEQWGWVGSKRRQHWLFYAMDTKRKKVLAPVFGARTSETLQKLFH